MIMAIKKLPKSHPIFGLQIVASHDLIEYGIVEKFYF